MTAERHGPARSRAYLHLALLSLLLLASMAGALAVGAVDLDWHAAWSDPMSVHGRILYVTRLPRVLLGVVAGGALSVAGLVLQALLRNPLAEPFTLGVSSGAALGAFVAMQLGFDSWLPGVGAVAATAFAAALVTVVLVYRIAATGPAVPVSTMLLAGVTLSYFFGAVIMVLHFLADYGQSYRFLRWMMGSLDVTGHRVVLSILPMCLLGLIALAWCSRDLNLIAAGDAFAAARGADVARLRRWVFFAASTLTGAVVSAVGPIGFVGLIVPHMLRRMFGVDHRFLMPAAMLFGGAFLVLCDTAARVALAPREIPVGVLTALLGGPFFLSLLRRQKSSAAFGGF